jgi:uncharacterized protein (DUF1800 family)
VTFPDKDMMAAIAVTRFGLGARPGELAAAQLDPVAWLVGQITGGPAAQPPGDLPPSEVRLAAFRDVQQQRQAMRELEAGSGDPQARRRQLEARVVSEATGQPMEQAQAVINLADAAGIQEEALARAWLASETDAPFAERWVMFWANHFTVSAVKAQSAPLVGPFEREVIRPGAFGRFSDMLVLSSGHPAMLTYLDQTQSVGPNSQAAVRRARGVRAGAAAGLNENLAREILELHTVGVDGGYTQDDVTEFARALTGWSIARPGEPGLNGAFVYRAQTHEPGTRTVMGKRYPDTGGTQALDILRDLAVHPSTARRVARKLAAHFVADDPPSALVNDLEGAFSRSGGDLAQVARTLVSSEAAWSPEHAKFKTPYELIVSAHRGLGVAPTRPNQIVPALGQLGQQPFRAPSPEGWADDAATWAAPDALIKRLNWAEDFAAQVSRGPREPLKVAQDSLGVRLGPQTASAIISAESRTEALAILFMSPEFQRR